MKTHKEEGNGYYSAPPGLQCGLSHSGGEERTDMSTNHHLWWFWYMATKGTYTQSASHTQSDTL